MKKGSHHLSFEIQRLAKGEATGLFGILGLCFVAVVVASVIVIISK
jgi:hypothetical protein